jgi:uncharacterized protein
MGILLRLVFLGIVAIVIVRVLQRALGLDAGPRQEEPPRHHDQMMRRCAWCKVHVPEGESTQSRGHFFCSEAHRDAYFREQR